MTDPKPRPNRPKPGNIMVYEGIGTDWKEDSDITIPDGVLTTPKWSQMVETFIAISEVMKTSEEPIVAMGGFAMFLYGNVNRDPTDVDFWTSKKGSKDALDLLPKDAGNRFKADNLREIAYTTRSGKVVDIDFATYNEVTKITFTGGVRVIDEKGNKIGVCVTLRDLFNSKYSSGDTAGRTVDESLKDYRDALFLIRGYESRAAGSDWESKKKKLEDKIKSLETGQK